MDAMVDYSKQIKQFADNKAVTAEREIMNGKSLKTAAKEFGYKDVQSMMATIAARGVLPPLTREERNCFQGQICFRAPTSRDKDRLAGQIGVSNKSVANWASGEYAPTPCVITAVAKALGCTRDELLSPVKECIGAAKHTVKKREAPTVAPPQQTVEAHNDKPKGENAMEKKPTEQHAASRIIVTKTARGEFADYEEDTAQAERIQLKLKGTTFTHEEMYRFGEELQEVATLMA